MLKFRQVGWNGIRLTVPSAWETHIGGHNHLIFEADFSPLLEIRWKKSAKGKNPKSRSIEKQIKRTTTTLREVNLPSEWSFLEEKYYTTCFGKSELAFSTGICVCRECQSLLIFQLSHKEKNSAPLLRKCLKSLSCHHSTDEPEFWSLQDFQLTLPPAYSLIDYSFTPGLTRISFRTRRTVLHIGKLGPADARLKGQTLEEILRSLAGTPDLKVQFGENKKSCAGYQAPTIGKQIALRFKRDKPFVRAEIHHDSTNNRLLAIVLESLRPIPPEICQSIWNNYEIIQA